MAPEDETSGPQRHPVLLNAETTVLIIIDLQGTLFRMCRKPERLIDRLAILLEATGHLDVPVIVTEHYPKGLGATDPEVLALLPEYSPLTKTVFSCCGAPDFEAAMAAHAQAGRRQALIAGIETHICVSQTVHDLLHRGYQVHVATDCVSARHKRDHEVGIRKMLQAGALETTTETAAFEQFYEATSPQFKAFARWLKEQG